MQQVSEWSVWVFTISVEGFLRASLASFQWYNKRKAKTKLCVQPDNLKSFEVFSRLRFVASRFEQNMTSRFSAVWKYSISLLGII